MAEMNKIKKTNWVSSFNIIGKAMPTNYTFKIDEQSKKSAWIYNQMYLAIDCGEKHGVVNVDMNGGHWEDGSDVIRAFGKDEDGNFDPSKKLEIAWSERFDADVLEQVARTSFITVGIEKTDEEKIFYNEFLSAYDAILYIKEHLKPGMNVRASGRLQYQTYNGNTTVRKEVNRIVLSDAEPSATFIQTVLLNEDSVDLNDIDKDKGCFIVHARVLDYMKEVNGVTVRGQFPLEKAFEFKNDFSNKEKTKKVYTKLLNVKKDVTKVTFVGDFIESGATVTATWEDVPEELRDLVDMELMTEDEAIAKCTVSGSKEKRMVFTNVYVKQADKDSLPVVQLFPEEYTEEELDVSWVYEQSPAEEKEEVPFDEDKPKSKSNDDDVDLDDILSLL